MTRVIEAGGVSEAFGKVQALTGFDPVQDEGSVLGSNGAGKTTFVSDDVTLVQPDSDRLPALPNESSDDEGATAKQEREALSYWLSY